MMPSVKFFQPLARDVRIDLGSGNVTVTEQHLHDTQVRAMIQKMGRKRMA